MMRSLLPTVAAAAVFAATAASASAQAVARLPGTRRIFDLPDRPLRQLTAVDDTVLLRPMLMQARGDQVVVFDWADKAVKAFRLDGKGHWRFGRSGGGPGELSGLNDMQVDGRGRVWCADGSNAKVVVLTADGRLEREIHLELPLTRAVPVRGGFLGLMGSRPYFLRFDEQGRLLDSLRPPAIYGGAAPLTTEPVEALAPSGEILVAYRWADFVVRIDTAGRSEVVATRNYLHTLRLPREARAISATPGLLVVLAEDPAPALEVYRLER